MKTTIQYISAGALIGAALAFGPAAFGQQTVITPVAQQQTTTTTTSSDGTVTEFSPTSDTVVLRSQTSTEPVRYTYSKTTTVVDQNGAPVDISVIKTGVPVQVYYDQDGDQMVARKIVVQTTPADPGVVVKKTVTTTTTQGQ